MICKLNFSHELFFACFWVQNVLIWGQWVLRGLEKSREANSSDLEVDASESIQNLESLSWRRQKRENEAIKLSIIKLLSQM